MEDRYQALAVVAFGEGTVACFEIEMNMHIQL